ncbi:HD family hydrolase [Bacteroidota bacterium]
MNQKNSNRSIVNYIFELAQLRKETRHGWQRIYEIPESVAEHTQRAAVLGYILAHLEGLGDPDKIATMILFHDAHETRTGDADVIQRKYLKIYESRAAKDQLTKLGKVGAKILKMWEEVEYTETTMGKIAKDAEILEMAFTARELIVRGNKAAQSWLDRIKKRLKTKSGLDLLEIINNADPNEWWQELNR